MYNVVNGAFALSEFALGIALTVFVGTTVLLLILLICLAASKSFRAVFFREHAEKTAKTEKAYKPKKSKNKSKEPDPLDELEEVPVPPIPRPTVQPKTAKSDKEQAREELEFLEMVETIPLEAMTLPPDRPRAHRIPLRKSSEGGEGGTYSPRMITITRARGGHTKPEEHEVPSNPTPTARRGVKRD